MRELLRVDLVYAYPQWSPGGSTRRGDALKNSTARPMRSQFEQVVDQFGDTQWSRGARLGRYQQSAADRTTRAGNDKREASRWT